MTVMTVSRRLRLYWSMMRYGNAHNRDFAVEHIEFYSRMASYLGDLKGRRILDIGCGKSCWLTLLLHSAGAQVTGIDNEVTEPGHSLLKYAGIVYRNGFERALRTAVWDLVYAKPYYRTLERHAPFALAFEGIDTRSMSAAEPAFPDDTFDLVVSHEVFEHIHDVSSTLAGLFRIMKPGSRTYIYVHNYTSLSGGHHIAWKYPDTEPSQVVPPWDHLRENRYPDIPSWLNRMREDEYRLLFERRFDILDWFPTAIEGRSLLTPSVREELQDYSERELLTKGFVIVATPRKTSH